MLAADQRVEFGPSLTVVYEVDPEVKSRIEERIRNVPEANRERAFVNEAKKGGHETNGAPGWSSPVEMWIPGGGGTR